MVCPYCNENEEELEVYFDNDFVEQICTGCITDTIKRTITNLEDIDRMDFYSM